MSIELVSSSPAEVATVLPTSARVVAIGASAAGLESLEQLLAELPADTGLGYVVVAHPSPELRGLDERLARHSAMPVRVASDGAVVTPDQIHLVPPATPMVVRDGRLRLAADEPVRAARPIDHFLRSLALDQGARAIAIVLAGTGPDGAHGLAEIERAGGRALAETTGRARGGGAPRDLARVLRGLTAGVGPGDAAPPGGDRDLLATYDQLLDRYMPPSLLVDADLRLIDSFGGAEDLLKVGRRRPTRKLVDMLDGDLRAAVAGAVQRAVADDAAITCAGVRVPDGDGDRRCTVTAEPLPHPRTGPRHLLVTFDGLDARAPRPPRPADDELVAPLLAAQRELEERRARIELLLDSTAEAIFGLDRDGRCTFVNPAFLRMVGLTSAEPVIGRAIHPLIHPTRADGTPHDEADCEIYRAVRDGVATHADDELLWRSDGTSLPIEYWSTPIRAGGAVVGAVVTCLDVTERKQAEAEIRTAARRREQFLAMLSHELRNPLAAVLSALRVIERGRFDPDVLLKGQAVAERQARHMARLLDDLLDVSRITRGTFELRTSDGDLRAPIEAAIEATAPRFADRKLQLDVAIAAAPFPIHGDPDRLQQVVVNLLANAATYSPPGSRVELRLDRDGDVAVLRVIDRGMGIEAELLGQIFELFVQAAQHLDRPLGGLGIGLSLTRTIVELHGGAIEARSDGPGRGAELIVRLPLRRRPPPPDRPEPRAVRRCRVVLVEDLADSREMLRLLLETSGHEVVDVDDGRAALEAIERERPEVALIDIGLPGMNGYEVAQEVRRRPHLDDVLLVALTGYGAPSDIATARAAGFDEHVIKPPDLDRIDEILARRAGLR
ncbi:MAG TPA: chemotaxis protein CheB [Kofleriaceae bacterium]|nr:chemotaxis protein CheB [Kofleriaceae bacterium]